MDNIKDSSEKMDLLQKTADIDNRQKLRKKQMEEEVAKEKEKERDAALVLNQRTSESILNREEAHRKLLVAEMIEKSNEAQGPVVKVLANIQGNLKFISLTHYLNSSSQVQRFFRCHCHFYNITKNIYD